MSDSKKEIVLSTKNKKIVEFYNSHKYLDFEQVNLLCVDLFENILMEASNSINKSISSQILSEFTDNKKVLNEFMNENRAKFNDFTNHFISLQTNITKMNNDFMVRMIDNKKDYIDDIKSIINNYSNEKNERIASIIERNNNSLSDKTIISLNESVEKISNYFEKSTLNYIDKTKVVINEIIPNNFDKIRDNINHDFSKFSLSINQDLQRILANDNENDKQLLHIIEKTQESISKDVIPNNLDRIYNNINHDFSQFTQLISKEIQKVSENSKEFDKDLLESIKKLQENDVKTSEKEKILDDLKIFLQKSKENQIQNQIDLFLNEFETKFNTFNQSIHQTIQQPLLHNLTSSEERISSKINHTEERIDNKTNSISKELIEHGMILNELKEHLNKYKNPSLKGNIAENHLRSLLNKIYPTAEVIDSSNVKESGDCILKRKDMDDILIETKEYDLNINSDEVKKFIRDSSVKKMHGIMLSQKSGITGKNNFEIEFNNGKFLIYIHNADFQSEKITAAVDIIDNLSSKLKELNRVDNDVISPEVVENINKEYQEFIMKKQNIQTLIKDFEKKMTSQVNDLSFCSLDNYLSSKFASTTKKITCSLCNSYVTSSSKSLSAHMKHCKKNIINDDKIQQ